MALAEDSRDGIGGGPDGGAVAGRAEARIADGRTLAYWVLARS